MERNTILVVLSMVVFSAVGCEAGDAGDDAEGDTEAAVVEENPEESEEKTSVEAGELPALQTYGEMRRLNMGDDYSGVVDLSEALEGEKSLDYGVGAIAGLDGEITVWDDTVYLARGGNEPTFESRTVENLDGGEATILFGGSTSEWKSVDAPDARDLNSIGERLEAWRTERGVDESLLFRITDPEATADWHVVDGERLPEGGVQSCEERKRHAHQVQTDGRPVRVTGVYTTDHTGIVVSHASPIHAHVVTDDGESGHVDELELSSDASIEVAVR